MQTKILTAVKNNYLLLGFIVLGFIAFLSSPEKSEKVETPLLPEPKSVDTFVPRGLVLVPIEIANAESLSSLIGDVGGVVDLYLATTPQQKGGIKVGSKLKLLRAPLNPQQYAVLVKETDSAKLLSYTGPFIAVVQNPEENGPKLSSSGPQRIRVEYQN